MEGTPFGRYRLLELLGRGGMGEVWRAYDTAIDRIVALKMLLPHYAKDPEFDTRFRREARAAARLDDPHVVPIYDVGEIDGRLYVSMRLIEGHDLQEVLAKGPLTPARAVRVIVKAGNRSDPNVTQSRPREPGYGTVGYGTVAFVEGAESPERERKLYVAS